MGNLISKDTHQGLVLQDDRVTNDNLASKDAVSQPSIYTQLKPKPMLPSSSQQSNLTLKASHKQSEDGYLEILTNRAGHPIPEEGGFVWRDVDGGDSHTDYKGWDGYQAATGWNVRHDTDVTDLERDMNIIRLQSGNMLMTSYKTDVLLRVEHYNVETSGFTTYTFTPIGPLVATPKESARPCLVQLPSGRVLLYVLVPDKTQIDCYYSDDEGATWDIYSTRVLKTSILDHNGDVPDKVIRIRAAYSAGEVCLIVWTREKEDSTFGSEPEVSIQLHDCLQYASDDLGQNFLFVSSLISTYEGADASPRAIRYPKVLPQHGGGFWLSGYRRYSYTDITTSGLYFIRRSPSAFVPFLDQVVETIYLQDEQAVDLGTNNDYGCTFWADEDNTYYALVEDILDTATTGRDAGVSHLLLRSFDAGANWEEWKSYTLQTHDSDVRLTSFDADCSGGKTLCLTRWTEITAGNDYALESIAILYLGGFSNHTLPGADVFPVDDFNDVDYIGFGDTNDYDYPSATTPIQHGRLYLPLALPDATGWTLTAVGAPTVTLTTKLTVGTAGDRNYYTESFAPGSADQAFFEGALMVNSGGSQGNDTCIIGLQLSDNATYTYGVHLRMSTTGFAVRDVRAPATLGTVTNDMTKLTHIRVIISQGFVSTWWSADDDIKGHIREWTVGPAGAIASAGAPGGGDKAYWAHFGAGTANSTWSMAGHNFYPTRWSARYEKVDAAEVWENPRDIHSRSYSPLPSLLYDGVKLSAQSGPTRLDEVFEIIASYDYPITNLDPRISPSPNQTWRGEDEASVELVYEMDEGLGDGMFDNIPLCVMALNANIKSFRVDYWDGAAYQPLGTANAYDGWTGLKYVRAGNRYTVDVDEAVTAKNYFYYEQHAGDTFLFDDAERPAKIEHNTEGAWYSDGNGVALAKLPRLVVDKDAVSGAASSGTGQVWRKNFGIVLPDLNPDDVVKLRITIDSHKTADDYYEVGSFIVGSLTAFGQSYDNGWQIQDIYNNNVIERLNGQRRVRNNGPKRKAVSFSWANTAVDLCQTQIVEPTPDYTYGKDGTTDADKAKSIYSSVKDVTRTVTGFVERAQQAKLPVLLLRNVPFVAAGVDSISLSKTLDHVYGRIVNDPQIDNVVGTELEDEVDRLNVMTIEEEV